MKREYISHIKDLPFKFPAVDGREPQLNVEIWKAERLPKDAHTYKLTAPSERKPATITIAKDETGEEKLFLGLADKEAFFFRFRNSRGKGSPIAVKVLIDDINVLTGVKDDDVNQLVDGGDSNQKTGQNYIVVPPQEWLDGWRKHIPGKNVANQFVAVNNETMIGGSRIQIIAIPYRGYVPVPMGIGIAKEEGGEVEQIIYESPHPAKEFDAKQYRSYELTATLDETCRAKPMSEASTTYVVEDKHMKAAPIAANSVVGIVDQLQDTTRVGEPAHKPIQPKETVAIALPSSMSEDEHKDKMSAFFRTASSEKIFNWLKCSPPPSRIPNPYKSHFQVLINRYHPNVIPWVNDILEKLTAAHTQEVLKPLFLKEMPESRLNFLFMVLFPSKKNDALQMWKDAEIEAKEEILDLFPEDLSGFPEHAQQLIQQFQSEYQQELDSSSSPSDDKQRGRKRDREDEGEDDTAIPDSKRPPANLSISRGFASPGQTLFPSVSETLRSQLCQLVEAKYSIKISVQQYTGHTISLTLLDSSGPEAVKLKDFLGPFIGTWLGNKAIIDNGKCLQVLKQLQPKKEPATFSL